MADFTCITDKRRWRDFFASIQEGEEVKFKAATPEEIEVVRAVASNINTRRLNDFVFSVKGDRKTMNVIITTKDRL